MSGHRRPPRDAASLRKVSPFDKVVGLVAFGLLTLAAGYLIIHNAPLQNEALVTIYFAITAGILSTALLGGGLNLKTDVQGVGIRAAGGAAVFALIMVARFFIVPAPGPQIVSEDNFVQSYGRVFGAMEFPALLRILDRQQGDVLANISPPTPDDPLGKTQETVEDLIKNGCPTPNESGSDDANEMMYSSGCAFQVDRNFIVSLSQHWPERYRHARIIRAPIARKLLDANTLPEALLYTANAQTTRQLLCLVNDNLINRVGPSGVSVQTPAATPADDPLYDLLKTLKCPAHPSKQVGYLFVVLSNKSQHTFDKVTLSFKAFAAPAGIPVGADFYDLANHLRSFDKPEAAGADIGERVLKFLNWQTLPQKLAGSRLATYAEANCVTNACTPDTTIKVADVAPGASLLVVLAGYRKKPDGLEDAYLTDVLVPLSVDYEIDGHKISEPIDPPGREMSAASRIEFEGGWGWGYQ